MPVEEGKGYHKQGSIGALSRIFLPVSITHTYRKQLRFRWLVLLFFSLFIFTRTDLARASGLLEVPQLLIL